MCLLIWFSFVFGSEILERGHALKQNLEKERRKKGKKREEGEDDHSSF